jgi:putative transposase
MKGFYHTMKSTNLPSCYKLGVITRACSILESRKKSKNRGILVHHSKPLRPSICIISGFFVTAKGRLFIPLQRDKYADVLLSRYLQEKLAGKKMRSLTISSGLISICYSEDVEAVPVMTVFGVDRNEKNLTFGSKGGVVQLDMSKTGRIRQTTREVVGSFRRADTRVRRKLASKYWKRARNRTDQILHTATNSIVETAFLNDAAIALEDLTNIRKMYWSGSGQGPDFRFRLNSWSHRKAYWMLEYKSVWRGLTVIPLTKTETHGSSSECSACGEKLHSPAKDDAEHRRMLWCQSCKTWMDRDVNAAIVLSKRGLARFVSSLPQAVSRSQQVSLLTGEKGLAGEAVKGNGTTTPILRVDASKLGGGYGPST